MIEPKKYLEYCQVNSVFPKTKKLKHDEAEYYPKKLLIGFSVHGDVEYSAIMDGVVGNVTVQARLKELREVDNEG